MFSSSRKNLDVEMQPYSFADDLDSIEPYNEFDGLYNTEKLDNNSHTNTSVVSNLNLLDAPYLSVTPMLALNDNFEPRSDEEGGGELQFHGSFQSRPHQQSANINPFNGTDTDFQECLSTDQCPTFDQMDNSWADLENVSDFLKYDILNTQKSSFVDPTLAELNANGKSLFDEFTNPDLPLSEECSQFKIPTVLTSPQDSQDAMALSMPTQFLPNLGLDIKSEPAECPSPIISSSQPSCRRSTLQDLLLQKNYPVKREPSPVSPIKQEPISTNKYSDTSFPQLVPCTKRRPRTSTMSSTGSGCESLPGTSYDAQSNESDYRPDDGSKNDSDSNDDFSDSDDSNHSNDHSDDDYEKVYQLSRTRSKSMSMVDDSKSKRRNKRGKFFWQYNLQAKGPKGNRLPLATEFTNPHKLEQVTDPVFSPRCIIKGIKHTGKARKGDGNDLTPNPEKLHQIGQSLKNLNQVINDLTPVNELPVNVRPKSRKEKNKLASRVCRLKKKAQHEANKLKLFGLENEYRQLLDVLKELKKQVNEKNYESKDELLHRCLSMENEMIKVKVAGRSVEFVNEILEKVAAGVPSGGLKDK